MNDPRRRIPRVELACGDLVREEVDALVNAASSALRGGGGVDGAIHRAAGPGLLRELEQRYPDGCPTGEVRASLGHALRARFVLHAVGPIWRGGVQREAEHLAGCYRKAVELASELGARSLAFPAISCGVYGYPLEPAAAIALETLEAALARAPRIERARVVLFTPALLEIWQRIQRRQAGDRPT
jgi:O-acetyl-ADP-ribose deacetylase (regulator of RNase III)